MASRQVARETERFTMSLPEGLLAMSVSERDAPRIGEFLLRCGHPLRPECEAGTLAGAIFYVTRLFDYHRRDRNYPLALAASTIVQQRGDAKMAGVCLLGGGGADGQQFGIYDIEVDPALQNRGIGSSMIQRSLDLLARNGVPELYLWRDDDNRAKALYERLGFRPTGSVE
jgi:ribosomal protein S18 acetylase RimI-like enzyme